MVDHSGRRSAKVAFDLIKSDPKLCCEHTLRHAIQSMTPENLFDPWL